MQGCYTQLFKYEDYERQGIIACVAMGMRNIWINGCGFKFVYDACKPHCLVHGKQASSHPENRNSMIEVMKNTNDIKISK